jgi:multisubunit Na+/H+ antiporter MnhB subunit
MITLYIAGWLLSGFAAAYIGYRWVDDRKFDTEMLTAIIVTGLGGVALVIVLMALVAKVKFSKFFGMTVFKSE